MKEINLKKIFDFCEKYAPELMVLLICAPMLLLRNVNSYHTCFFFTDYSTGFGGKKLLGEICSLWLPEIVRKRHILPLIVSAKILLTILFAGFCGQCIRKNKNTKTMLFVILLVYLFCPFSFRLIIALKHVDLFLTVATLGFVYLFMKHRGTWYYYILTLSLLSVACLIHHIFCNIYFPLIFALFIYDIFTEEQGRTKKIVCYGAITICLFVLFCAIILFSTMNVDFNSYYQYLQTRVTESIEIGQSAVYYELYAKLPEHIVAYIRPMWQYNIARFVVTLIVLAPLFCMFWVPWIFAIRNTESKREKYCYILMQLSLNLLILPAYIMAVDYERWTYAYLFNQFCLFMLMYYRHEETFITQVNNLMKSVNDYKIMVLLVAIYIVSFQPAIFAQGLPFANQICEMFGLTWQTNEILPNM